MNKLILQVERRANRSLAQRIADTDNRLSRSMYDVIPREGADTGRMLACALRMLLDEQRANDMAAFNRSVDDIARAFGAIGGGDIATKFFDQPAFNRAQ